MLILLLSLENNESVSALKHITFQNNPYSKSSRHKRRLRGEECFGHTPRCLQTQADGSDIK